MNAERIKKVVGYVPKNKRVITLNLATGDLSPHPLLERVNMLPDLIAREVALGLAQGKGRQAHKEAAEQLQRELDGVAQSICANGIREKLKVVKNPKGGWWIADGRHRWTIAKQYGLATVPCEEVAESDVTAIIMDGVQHRQMSKGGRAYLAVLMHPEVATEAKKGGNQAKRTECALLTGETLALTVGVSPRLIDDAIGLFREFGQRGDIREKFEPAIWIGAGLAKLRAGIEGYKKTGQEPDEEPETEEQARKRINQQRVETALLQWTGVTTSLKHWKVMPRGGQKEVIKVAADTIREAPQEFVDGLLDSLGATVI